jgi:hypothetical protein
LPTDALWRLFDLMRYDSGRDARYSRWLPSSTASITTTPTQPYACHPSS